MIKNDPFREILKMMPKDSKSVQFFELNHPDTPESRLKSFNMILDSGLYIIKEIFKDFPAKDRSMMQQDAMILFQMTISKGVAVLDLFNGLNHTHSFDSTIRMKGFKDPMSMSVIVRSQFEAFCNFNNIYLSSDNPDVQKLLYDLWVLSGLNYRQSFVRNDMEMEHQEKAKKEEERIKSIMNEFEANPVFLSLDEKNQKQLLDGIEWKKFQFIYTGEKFTKNGWSGLMKRAGVMNVFDKLYAEMSLKSHPSNVSVFQFAQMFDNGTNNSAASFSLEISKIIMAFTISDFIKYIPQAMPFFEKLPKMNQILVCQTNSYLREKKWLISNVHSEYGKEVNDEFLDFIKQHKG